MADLGPSGYSSDDQDKTDDANDRTERDHESARYRFDLASVEDCHLRRKRSDERD